MKIRRGVLGLLVALIPCAAAAQPSAPQEGNAYALVIGVGAYPRFPLGDRLHYAARDAEAFRDFVRSPQGGQFAEERIRFLAEERATRADIFREILWLERRVRPNDRLYVFFTGHGLVHEGGRAYLMPYDADPDDPSGLGIRADEFVDGIRDRVAAGRVLFFIDACYSAAALVQGGAAKGAENVVPALRDVWRSQANRPAVSLGFFSASANQRSWEDDALQHGVFTHFLLQGLRGGADGHSGGAYDNVVTAGELRSFLTDSVSVYSRRKFEPQEPAFSPVFDGGLAVATVPTPVRPIPPASDPVRLPTGGLSPVQWRPAAPGVFTPAQTRAFLSSLGTVLVDEDYEPREDLTRGDGHFDSAHVYIAGGRMHLETRYMTENGASLLLGEGGENFVLHLTALTVSADSTKHARYYINARRDSGTHVMFTAFSGGSPGTLLLVHRQNAVRLTDIQCSARNKPFWQPANIYMRHYYGRLQVWFDETLCADVLTVGTGPWELDVGTSGFIEAAFDDVLLVRLP